MALAKIKYKAFLFPYNPEQTSMRCDRAYIKHKYPQLAGNELEDFGVNAVIITGSGVFYGKNWRELQSKLYNEYIKGGVGDMYHPVFTWVRRGLMTNLEFTVQPELETIHYTFEIVADTQPNVKENTGKFAVKQTGNRDTKKTYKVGDVVNFHGGTHYYTSYADAEGYPATAGKAKINLGPDCKGNGKAHPWSLIHIDSTSNVYGWVDEGTFD